MNNFSKEKKESFLQLINAQFVIIRFYIAILIKIFS